MPLPFVFVCYDIKDSSSITVHEGSGTFTWHPGEELIEDCLNTFSEAVRARLGYDRSYAIVYKSVSKIN